MSGSRRQKQGPHPSLSSLSLVSSAPMILVCPLPPPPNPVRAHSELTLVFQRLSTSLGAGEQGDPGAIVGGGQQKHHTHTHTHIIPPAVRIYPQVARQSTGTTLFILTTWHPLYTTQVTLSSIAAVFSLKTAADVWLLMLATTSTPHVLYIAKQASKHATQKRPNSKKS